MNNEEVELRQVLQHFQRQSEIAQQQGNVEALRDATLGQVEPYAKLAQLRVHGYDFAADAYLDHLRQIVDWLSKEASAREKNGLQARLLYTEVIFSMLKAVTISLKR